MNHINRILTSIAILSAFVSEAQESKSDFDLNFNQVGFYPQTEKIAILSSDSPKISGKFKITSLYDNKCVYEGRLSKSRKSPYAESFTYIIDFTSLTTPGIYCISVNGRSLKKTFQIEKDAFGDIRDAALKAFYYQRASTVLQEKYAGRWKRTGGHPDTTVFVHPSASNLSRPQNSVISSPGGWYDAGDYNKYIVNSGYTVSVLMSLYEDFTTAVKSVRLNIPESGNSVPDLLDEIRWNLEWMLTMQDPSDGGVYHKLTTDSFEGFISPEKCKKTRYVVKKTVTAALQFAGSMAQASRIFAEYDNEFASECANSATLAFEWAVSNPDATYTQNIINRLFDPDIRTGEYGDENTSDEWFRASSELYLLTKDSQYIEYIKQNLPASFILPGWKNISGLGIMTCLRHRSVFGSLVDTDKMSRQIDSFLFNNIESVEDSYYLVPFGTDRNDYVWGSNSRAASLGSVMMFRYSQTGDRRLLDNALRISDYLMGRNPSGYCFITGYGEKSPKNIHHRISVSDNIVEPVPGLLVGGPNKGHEDRCNYTSSQPDLAYIDEINSYASNEIAINWQANLAYLLTSISQYLQVQ